MPRTRSSARAALVVTTLLCFHVSGALTGCGGDDDAEKPQAMSAAGAKATATPSLDARTAGKACTTDSDCGKGNCAKQLPDMTTTAFFGGSGNVDAPGGYCTAGCSTSTDCGEAGTCISAQQGVGAITGLFGGTSSANTPTGKCYASCKDASGCREGYRCMSTFGLPITAETGGAGSCQPTPATDKLSDSAVGSMCSQDADCGGGRCMTTDANAFGQSNATYAGGYCTGRCLQDSDCGASGVCTGATGGGTGSCYRKCESDTDCGRDGYRCRADASTGGIPGQSTSTTKLCVPGVKPLPDGVVGKACTDDAACGSAAMSCQTQLTSQFGGQATALPGGYCTQSCVDDSDCGAGGVCSGGFGGFVMGNCFKPCSAASDCREGYSCATPSTGRRGGGIPGGMGSQTGTTAAQTVCTPTPPAPADQDAGAQDAGAP